MRALSGPGPNGHGPHASLPLSDDPATCGLLPRYSVGSHKQNLQPEILVYSFRFGRLLCFLRASHVRWFRQATDLCSLPDKA